MSSFVALRSAAALCVVALVGAGPPARLTAPVADKLRVALAFNIDAQSYRRPLGDLQCSGACLTLATSLADSVRALVRAKYPFAAWSIGVATPDTLEFHWVDDPDSETQWSQLEFRIRSREPERQLPFYRVSFEDYSEVSSRFTNNGWNPDSMRAAWLRKLGTKLAMPELLVRVFGRIPVVATVTFLSTGKVRVDVRPVDIGATDDMRPTFDVIAQVSDPRDGTSELANIRLAGCLTLTNGAGLSCDPERLRYVSKELVGADLQSLVSRAAITPKSLRVSGFVSRANPSYGAPQFPADSR